MKNILMVAGFFSPHRGGTERFIEGMSDFISKRHNVTILTTNTEKVCPKDFLGDVEVIRLPACAIFSGSYPLILPTFSFFVLMRHVLKKRYDAIVTHTRFFETTFLAYFMSIFLGIPLLHLEHGSSHIMYKNKFLEKIAHVVDHAFGYLLLRRAFRIAAVSHVSSGFLRHLGTEKNIEIIPNFVDTNVFKKRGMKNEKLTVSYVGRLVAQKGVSDLLFVWADVEKRFDARLFIVGEGEEKEKLKSVASSNVFFLGEKDAAGVAEVLSLTDILVNPSLSEGLPSSVLEACACGLPVIATDVGGTRDIIEEEFLVLPQDRHALLERLLMLLGDEEKRRNVGERNGRIIKERFSLDVVGRIFEGFIEI